MYLTPRAATDKPWLLPLAAFRLDPVFPVSQLELIYHWKQGGPIPTGKSDLI